MSEEPATLAVAPIATCITRCCRDWTAPFGYKGGRCGSEYGKTREHLTGESAE